MSVLWYKEPAADWNHALPLGNGSMGAMCFGGTLQARFSLDDDTVWSGGFTDRLNPDAARMLPKVRRLIREGRISEAEELAEEALMAIPEGEQAYEPLYELTVQLKTLRHNRYQSPIQSLWYDGRNMQGFEPEEGVTGYRRTNLNLLLMVGGLVRFFLFTKEMNLDFLAFRCVQCSIGLADVNRLAKKYHRKMKIDIEQSGNNTCFFLCSQAAFHQERNSSIISSS